MSCTQPEGSPSSENKGATVQKPCCAPSGGARQSMPATAERHSSKGDATEREDATERMVRLPGGPFLMGTDYKGAFPDDGEGPVREVTLDPFWIDRVPVTNALFGRFVQETNYRTEAERFGWSFVFWSHIPQKRFNELVEDTVAAAPWWCKVRGASWRSPEGPGSDTSSRSSHPVPGQWRERRVMDLWRHSQG